MAEVIVKQSKPLSFYIYITAIILVLTGIAYGGYHYYSKTKADLITKIQAELEEQYKGQLDSLNSQISDQEQKYEDLKKRYLKLKNQPPPQAPKTISETKKRFKELGYETAN